MKSKHVTLFAGFAVLLFQAVAFGEAVPEPAVEEGGGFGDYLASLTHSVVYIFEAFVLFYLAKVAYTKLYRKVDLSAEMFTRDNQAAAVSTCGYYFGILLALGGAISGSSNGLSQDIASIGLYGIMSIVLMLVASIMCEHILLPQFNNTKEVIEDRNLGTAFVEAGVYTANGLILLRSGQGSTGTESSQIEGVFIAVVFWGLAQIALIVAGRVYEIMTPHKIHEEIERDNAAVGLAFGGAIVGMGNIVSAAVSGDFYPNEPGAWGAAISTFVVDTIFGLIMLIIIHRVTDYVLAPNVSLAAEQTQEKPNVGAGLVEAFGYIGASMLVVWSL
jgi:uncharacterized membrane protein YjfL (UPF0719 family)